MLNILPKPHPAAASASGLLALCISYHSRARSLPQLLGQIQAVFTPLAFAQGSIRELYPRASSSPILGQDFFAGLAKAIHTFITPGQVLSTAQDLIHALTLAHETFTRLAAQSAGDSGLGSRKKARKSRTSTGANASLEMAEVDAAAVSFAFLARLAACVLPALPGQTVTSEIQEEVRECLHQADFVKDDLFLPEPLDGEDRRSDSWATHIVLAAALRLNYALQAATRLEFPVLQAERQAMLVNVHQRANVLPELFLEAVNRFRIARLSTLTYCVLHPVSLPFENGHDQGV